MNMIGQNQAPSTAPMFPPPRRRRMMMHMTFFWGKDTEVLFDGWPGRDNLGMYWLCLAVIFLLAAASEWLSRCRLLRPGGSPLGGGLAQTAVYTVRTGLSYLVMLAVMSFNGGVFLAAMAGFGLGFFVFGSRAFRSTDSKIVTCVQSHC
ncbi:PREDICTED: copper transporter 3 [Tarenaya hassleriana]|uniref:copper transporter 3 n=1 Tax=Tarenaya hassleriana TaxID=28532 RepID=UPI00053C09CE|nr:PREDICTED: copper transporter 3 [Tarenaya hassleriana]